MDRISVRRFGLALGLTFAILYMGCGVVIMTLDRAVIVSFFNSLLHGFDVGPIIRTSMSWGEMIIGFIEIFILGWLIGATIASIYNLVRGKKDSDQ